MKKYLYSILAAGMLLGISCSENELVEATKGESQQVTYTINLPSTGSRAIEAGVDVGDGYYADRLIYAMYETGAHDKGVLVTGFVEDGEDGKFTVDITLAKENSYDILFMAYDPENCIFNIDNNTAANNNLKALTMKSKLDANKEQYDAFVGKLLGQNINTKNKSVDLIRPFAQVNAATSYHDLDAVKDLNAEVTTSKFTIYGAPNQLNIFDGSVNGSTTHVYKQAAILTRYDAGENDYPKNEVLEIDNEDWYYLSMAYVLAGNQSGTYDADFEFYRKEDNEVVSSVSVTSMPIQANYRTNVLGDLLTQAENYTISILAGFDDAHTAAPAAKVEVKDENGLQAAIENAEEGIPTIIELGENVVLGQTTYSGRSRATESAALFIEEGQIITFNLNGFTIRQTKECTTHYSMIENHGKLTIVDRSEKGNGKLSFTDSGEGDPNFGWGSYTIANYGELIVEGGTIEHLGEQNQPGNIVHMICAIQQASGTTTINGGTISTPNYRSLRVNGGTITINDGNMNGQVWAQPSSEGTGITINGGTFQPMRGDFSSVFVENEIYDVTFSVTDGTFHTKIGCSDATTLAGSIIGGTFKEEAKNATDEALLAEGYMFEKDNDGNYIVKVAPVAIKVATLEKLTDALSSEENRPIHVTATIEISTDETVELDLNGKTVYGKSEKGNGAIINNQGTLVLKGNGIIKNTTQNGDAIINNTGNLTLADVTILGAPIADGGYSSYAVVSSGTMTISEGTKVSADRGCLKLSGTGTTTINGGTFTNNDIGERTLTSHVVDVEDGGSHQLTINGGTFQHLHTSTSGGVVICNRTTGTVAVNGGNFSGGNYYGNDNLSDYGYGGTFSVKGGTYSAKPNDKYIAEGYQTTQSENGLWTVTEEEEKTEEQEEETEKE